MVSWAIYEGLWQPLQLVHARFYSSLSEPVLLCAGFMSLFVMNPSDFIVRTRGPRRIVVFLPFGYAILYFIYTSMLSITFGSGCIQLELGTPSY